MKNDFDGGQKLSSCLFFEEVSRRSAMQSVFCDVPIVFLGQENYLRIRSALADPPCSVDSV